MLRLMAELVGNKAMAGRRRGILAAAPGRGEPPDAVHLLQRTAAARPVAGCLPRASPAARMGARPARRRPHARLPCRQMPPAITAKYWAAVGGGTRPWLRAGIRDFAAAVRPTKHCPPRRCARLGPQC